MNEYRYPISLKMEQVGTARYLYGRIQAGIKKGYQDFSIQIPDTTTYPNICVPIAGILEFYRKKGYDFLFEYDNSNGYVMHTGVEAPKNVKDYMGQIDLQHPFDKVWKFSTSEEVAQIVQAIVLAVRYADIIEDGVINSINWCLNEAIDNVLQHSEIGEGYIMAQLHKTTQQFSVCIFDAGIGIYNSLKCSKHAPASPLDAITKAMQEKVTRDERVGQGNGMWGLSEILNEAQGRLTIESSGAIYARNNGEVVTHERGAFYLGKDFGTTMIDFQFNYTNKINIAKALNGHIPDDLWLEDFEVENGDINIPVADLSSGTGTRKAAEQLRNLILNIARNEKKKVILDFSSVNIISSSYADELIGKLIMQYGFVFFNNHFQLCNLSAFNISVLNRSVQQRMAQMYYDGSITDLPDEEQTK